MDDGSCISLHFLDIAPRSSTAVIFEQANPAASGQAKAFLTALTESRRAFLTSLEAISAEASTGVEEAASAYLALLLGLVNAYGNGPAFNQDTESRLAALLSSGPTSAETTEARLSGTAFGRHAVSFLWQEVLLFESSCIASDAVYEMASVVVSVAVWKQQQAERLAEAGQTGSTSQAAIKAYNMLRGAAGLFQFAEKKCSPLLANICPSVDCSAQVLRAHTSLALADAQSITVLRAIQKGNAPSLIAGLAHDTMQLYQTAAQGFKNASAGKPGSKAGRYAEWKALVAQSYAFAYTGLSQLPSYEGGKAVRCAEQATSLCKAAARAAAAYDQAAPATQAAQHRYFDAAFTNCISTTYSKCKRENDTIYYKHVPEDLPALPDAKRLATATAYTLPPPDADVLGGVADLCFTQPTRADPDTSNIGAYSHTTSDPVASASGQVSQLPSSIQKQEAVAADHSSEGTACWRWLLVIIAAPLLLIISVVGVIVWLVLLPLKICCCPVGMCAQLVWDAVEWLIKAPLRGLLWASGQPWKPDHAPNSSPKQHASDSSV